MDTEKKFKLAIVINKTKKVWRILDVPHNTFICNESDDLMLIQDCYDFKITKKLNNNKYIYIICTNSTFNIDDTMILIDNNKLFLSCNIPYIFDTKIDIDSDADIYKTVAYKKDNCIKITIPRKINK